MRAAIANANLAGLGNHLVFDRRDVAHLAPREARSGLVLVNPPYGVRIGELQELEALYALLGSKLHAVLPRLGGRHDHQRSRRSAARFGLRAYRSHTFFNGAIECRLLRFHLDETALEPDRDVGAGGAHRGGPRRAPAPRCSATGCARTRAALATWARRNDVACYRVYDADMPEYAFAIDVYGNETSAGSACRNTRRRRRLPRTRCAHDATKHWPRSRT